jgi:serine/threonine protein kinase
MAEDAREGPLRLGDKFLKYVVRGLVGKGGHAWVYAGRDEFLERDVAIKILHRSGGVTSDMVRRGRAEAQLLHRLRHRNVVEVLDAGITDEGQLYIVMELLRGRTLREILRTRGRLSVAETLPLFIEMTNGVEAAHALNAIHRDLKPENVFVLHDNTPKILDFGIAKVIDSAFTTEKDVIHGTMLYMAPEQLEGYRATPRSDIYTFGLMLFETLLGRHPCLLGGGSPTVRELALIQTARTPPSLDELDATIPRHLARVVARAITKRPEQRFSSMSELGAALRDSLARQAADVQTDRISLRAGTTPLNAAAGPDTDRESRQPTLVRTEPLSLPQVRVSSTSGATPSPNTLPPVTRVPKASNEHDPRRRRTRRASLRRVLAAGAAIGTIAGAVAASLVTLPKTPVEADKSESALAALAASSAATSEPLLTQRDERREKPTSSAARVQDGVPAASPAASAPAIAVVTPQVALVKAKPRVRAERRASAKGSLTEPLAPPERKAWAE